MAALQDIQRILCPEMLIKRTCLRIRDICVRGICIPVRAFCLPAISLTRTPGGRHMEWAAAFFDPCFERLEKGVYYVGLVSVSQRLSFQKRVNFSQERVNFNTHTHTYTGMFLLSSNWYNYSGWYILYLSHSLPVVCPTSSSLLAICSIWSLSSNQCLFPLFQGCLH